MRISDWSSDVCSSDLEEWTIQSMAQTAGMSRTAFAELFTQTVGQPPIQYLAPWRAPEARRLLKNRRFSVAAIAEMRGYRCEATFIIERESLRVRVCPSARSTVVAQ